MLPILLYWYVLCTHVYSVYRYVHEVYRYILRCHRRLFHHHSASGSRLMVHLHGCQWPRGLAGAYYINIYTTCRAYIPLAADKHEHVGTYIKVHTPSESILYSILTLLLLWNGRNLDIGISKDMYERRKEKKEKRKKKKEKRKTWNSASADVILGGLSYAAVLPGTFYIYRPARNTDGPSTHIYIYLLLLQVLCSVVEMRRMYGVYMYECTVHTYNG